MGVPLEMCAGDLPTEMRQRLMRRYSQNPSHELGVAGERRRQGATDLAVLEDGGVWDKLVSVLRGGGHRRKRRVLVAE